LFESTNLTESVTHFIFQLAIILIAAKIFGEIVARWAKLPAVLGELSAGVIIGPYAFGALHFGSLGPLFELPPGQIINPFDALPLEIYATGQFAAIVLLFAAGLETDLRQFLRFAGPASLVAIGGLVLPFFLGAGATIVMGFADSLSDPVALFMGAIMTATSIGITARILSEINRLRSPEGTTIIAAAVLDDVLGILILTMVIAVANSGNVSLGELGIVGVKAIGFWLALTGLTLVASNWIFRALAWFSVPGTMLVVALAFALLGAALAESVGLAMIIGAYSIGLALSPTPLGRTIHESLMGVYHTLVPVFFVTMGMLVNIPAMANTLWFGIVLTILAIVGKIVGCGIPAMVAGFNPRGAWRVSVGMLPRGEVALIIAGVGLANSIIGIEEFGVAIMMTAITTLITPILLSPAFRSDRTGWRRAVPPPITNSSQNPHNGSAQPKPMTDPLAETSENV
jgi:Kef-type K+ transport system membrane component KefB